MLRCPNCSATTRQVKNGHNHSGSQRIKCQKCQHRYTENERQNGYPYERKLMAGELRWLGESYRVIARSLGVHHQTVINWLKGYKK